MLFELAVVGFMIGEYIYHRYIENHPPAPEPWGVVVPQTAEGSILPLLYGTCRVRSPVLAWLGNDIKPGQFITSTQPTGNYTAGTYSVDLLLILGIPFNNGSATISVIYAGDAKVALTKSSSSGFVINFNGGPIPPPSFSTGTSHDAQELTLTGVVYTGRNDQNILDNEPSGDLHLAVFPFNDRNRFFIDRVYYNLIHGTPSQPSLDVGTSIRAAMTFNGDNMSLVPFYRNQMVMFVHLGLGLSSSIPGIGAEVTSTSIGTSSDMGVAGWSGSVEADPIAVFYDVLTSTWGKLGLDPALIDLPSFVAASTVLAAEGNGVSMAVEQPTDAGEFIAQIMRQIDGVYYQEPTTGKIVVKLIRSGDAPVADLNPSNAVAPGPSWYVIQGWAEAPNQVRVSYSDRINNYNNTVVTAQSQAGLSANQNRLRSVDVQFPWCCTATLAGKLAARELAAVARPIVKATLKVDRTLYGVRIGDVVTLTWPQLGIKAMRMRVARVNRGKPGASAITIDMIRDVFDVSVGAFPPP